MRALSRDRLIPLSLAACSFVLAIAQRTGTVVADTKINLYTDPGRFLSDVASAWTPTADLGHVFAGQYGGYLFPMAPWFAGGHALGIPMWLVSRLWLGVLLALAAWGIVRLLDALSDRPRGVLHLVAGAAYVLNPYVAVYADRTSVSLLAYAAVPWMLLIVHRGMRDPRSWRWPAAFALVLTSTGGGVNAAVTGWIVLGPLLFVAYERWWGGVGRGPVWPFAWRMAVATAVANAWWVVPLLVHSKYGANFLPFTEQPGTIWSTTSLPESLRLMGFWTSYVGIGYGGVLRPFATHGGAFLFDLPVVVASLLVPALALAGFAWTRRWRYGPWFLGLTLIGLVVMSAGFPEGAPFRRGLTFTYNHVAALQFLRTTYKAGPLVAIGLACLAGAGFAELWQRLPRLAWRVVVSGAAAALLAIAAWPLTSGRAPDRQLELRHGVPTAWQDVGRLLDGRGDDSRALSLPGQLFSYYRWGGTVDNVLAALTKHPVATRYIVPLADLRAVDLQWATDALVSDEDALPGQLPPLLDLLGVGDVVLGADGDRSRSGEVGAGEAADVLGGQGLLSSPDPGAPPCDDAPLEPCEWIAAGRIATGPAAAGLTAHGRRLTVPRAAGRLGPVAHLPRVLDIRTRTGGIVRLLPQSAPTIVDGGAQGIVDLAGFGGLDLGAPISYAADLGTAQLRAAAQAGANIVVSDSNRRQAFVSSRLRNNRGAVLPADENVSADGVILDPFPAAGTNAQTISVLSGVRALTSPFSPQETQFPEHRPFAAMDGDLGTAWLADRGLQPQRHHLDVTFTTPRDIPYVDLAPYSDSRASTRGVEIGGHHFVVHSGWNHLVLNLHHVGGLSVLLSDVRRARGVSSAGGGIRELRIPGIRVSERLRPPVIAADALRGADISHSSLTYLFDRFTVAAPGFEPTDDGPWQAALVADRRDPEPQLERAFSVPAARTFTVRAWGRARIDAPDDELDRLAGYTGTVRVDASPRFENAPGYRASRALDGDPATAWIGAWRPGERAWLGWTTAQPHLIDGLRLLAPRLRLRRPTSVRVIVDGRSTPPLPVGASGLVAMAPVTGRSVRIEILSARFPPGTAGREQMRRAVGIAEVEGAPRAAVPTTGLVSGACTTQATVDGQPLRMRPVSSVAAMDGGEPLELEGCGAPLALAAGDYTLAGVAAPLVLDHLRLRSAAPAGTPSAAPAGRVLSAGKAGNGSRDGVRLAVSAPAWLVLDESYNRGWRATCDGHALGAPTPLEGYANAWKVAPGCRDASFSFAPNGVLWPMYLLSLVAALGFAVLLLVTHRRRRSATFGRIGPPPRWLDSPKPVGEPDPPGPWLLGRTLALGVFVFLAAGFVFSLRAGVVAAAVVVALSWWRVSTRLLVASASALLVVVVPVLYIAHPGHNHGGYASDYATQHFAAHWVTVGAFVLLTLALVRTLTADFRRGRAAAATPAPEPRRRPRIAVRTRWRRS